MRKKWEVFLGKILIVPTYKRLRAEIIIELLKSDLYKWLVKKIIPFIRFTTYYTNFTGIKYHLGYNQLEPGDIILTTDDKKLTSMLIPGEWDHAAICVSKDQRWEISEMTNKDYTKSCFFDVCKESTRVCIMRAPKWDPEYKQSFIRKCKSLYKAKYDVEFKFNIESLYCSELIYHSDYKNKLDLDESDLLGIGRDYISPDDIYNCKKLKVIWDSNSSTTYLGI